MSDPVRAHPAFRKLAIPKGRLTDQVCKVNVLDVNLKSVFFGCKHAITEMKTRGGGSRIHLVHDRADTIPT